MNAGSSGKIVKATNGIVATNVLKLSQTPTTDNYPVCIHRLRKQLQSSDVMRFTEKLDRATTGNFQIGTDGFLAYVDVIHTCLGTRVDFGQIVKFYGQPPDDEHRYSPARVLNVIRNTVWGEPDGQRICTSHVERQNLIMRMQIRRLTRLTNAFSKKWENLKAALALRFTISAGFTNRFGYSGNGGRANNPRLDY